MNHLYFRVANIERYPAVFTNDPPAMDRSMSMISCSTWAAVGRWLGSKLTMAWMRVFSLLICMLSVTRTLIGAVVRPPNSRLNHMLLPRGMECTAVM